MLAQIPEFKHTGRHTIAVDPLFDVEAAEAYQFLLTSFEYALAQNAPDVVGVPGDSAGRRTGATLGLLRPWLGRGGPTGARAGGITQPLARPVPPTPPLVFVRGNRLPGSGIARIGGRPLRAASARQARSAAAAGSISRSLRPWAMRVTISMRSVSASKWSRRSPSTGTRRTSFQPSSSLRLVETLERAMTSGSGMAPAGGGGPAS